MNGHPIVIKGQPDYCIGPWFLREADRCGWLKTWSAMRGKVAILKRPDSHA